MTGEVLIQGEEHSFTYQVATERSKFGISASDIESIDTHDALYLELSKRLNGRAVVPFVNTTKKRIGGSYDKVQRRAARIVARADLEIVLPLYGARGARRENITHIHSQNHALDQCRENLKKQFPNAELAEEKDTAGSARIVQNWSDRDRLGHAAITPHAAGEAAGLDCLVVEGLQDESHNVTSFYLLGRGENATVPGDATMTVAALEWAGTGQPRERIEMAVNLGAIILVHGEDIQTDPHSLIVEINSGGEHEQAIEETYAVLGGLYQVRYLGGYVPPCPQPSDTAPFLRQLR